MPTLLEICGAGYPAMRQGKPIPKPEGKSLLPVFRGKKRKGHDSLCWYLFGNRAIRQGKWKLVAQHDHPWELYDVEKDRSELNNLAEVYRAQGQYAMARPLLKRAIEIWVKTLGSEHPDVATGLENLAQLQRKTRQDTEADMLEKRAARIRAIKR